MESEVWYRLERSSGEMYEGDISLNKRLELAEAVGDLGGLFVRRFTVLPRSGGSASLLDNILFKQYKVEK